MIPLKPIFQAVGVLVDLVIETIECLGAGITAAECFNGVYLTDTAKKCGNRVGFGVLKYVRTPADPIATFTSIC